MKNRNVLGGVLASLAAVIGIVGHFVLFEAWYQIGMHAQSAEPGCEILLMYIHPAMSDLGILSGALFAVSAYGYFTKKHWAFSLAVVAIILALLGSWFINVPFMAASLPPVYFVLFFPYLLLYFLFMRGVQQLSWSRTLLAMLAGMAYIFCFMNGVASTSRIITIGAPIFTIVQRLHLIATIGWGVVTAGIILRPKEWMRVVGLAAGTLELVVGIPLAIVTAQGAGRFSLFALGPIACLVLVALFVWPRLWERLTGVEPTETAPSAPSAPPTAVVVH